MRRLYIEIILILLLSLNTYAQRGRVQLLDGTLVTDRGTLLRGSYISTDNTDYIPSAEEISGIKELGLNSIHLYAECAVNCDFAGQNTATIDSIVNMTERDSLYLVMTIGNCGEEGTFDSAFVNDFWKFYAPRYKDKTHVVYEIMNEPFPWEAPYDSITLAMERRAYDTIRFYAPETHILFMSYSGAIYADSIIQDIDKLGDIVWSNASIATHTYGIASEELRPFVNTIKDSGYAVTITESGIVGNEYMHRATTRALEEEFVSYLHFLQVPELVSNASVFKSVIESSDIRWVPDFGTWPESLTEIQYRNPYQRTEAGFFDEGLGFELHFLETIMGYISNGDYVAYYNFDFEDGADSLIFECSAGDLAVSSGSIELVLDSLNGTSVGVYPIPHTEDWDDYKNFRFPINTPIEGIHKFYFVFQGDHQWDLMNLKSFTFKKSDGTSSSELSLDDNQKIWIYPNPANDYLSIQSSNESYLDIYSMQGQLLLKHDITDTVQIIPIDFLKSGNYIIIISNSTKIYYDPLIVK